MVRGPAFGVHLLRDTAMARKNALQERLIAERARASAIVYLTGREDVTIKEETEEIGVDLLAFIRPKGRRGIRQFGVALKGDWESVTATRAREVLRPRMRELVRGGPFPFPVMLFFFTMQDDRAWYTWVAEPVISPDGGTDLRIHEEAKCLPLDERIADGIVTRINDWYDAYYARVGRLAASRA
jgi:hypothetical protein